MKLLIYVSLALIAFAGNSVICRLALKEEVIDASSFTAIRLISGIITLIVLFLATQKSPKKLAQDWGQGSWFTALMLFVYAVAFSYAYNSLDTGTGALVLFGSVQLTMIVMGFVHGNKLSSIEVIGIILAFAGFVYLILPSISTPSFVGFILMTCAGIAWAFYTLAGRGSNNPIRDTTYNFIRTTPFVLLLVILSFKQIQLTQQGVYLAILSGAVTSAIGYAIWYQALRSLSITQAAVVQLLVPIIAAIGGVLFASEMITNRLLIASFMVLGGILVVTIGHRTISKTN